MRIPRWLTHKTHQLHHPNGYIIYSESRRLGGIITNLCVWDGKEWHQAPLHLWNRHTDMDELLHWTKAHLPADAFRHRNT